jgi:hypothetical protein
MEACCLVRCYCKSFVNRVARARSNQMHSVTRPANLEDKVVSTSEFYLSPRYLTKCIGSFTYLKDLSRFTQVAIKMEQVAPQREMQCSLAHALVCSLSFWHPHPTHFLSFFLPKNASAQTIPRESFLGQECTSRSHESLL